MTGSVPAEVAAGFQRSTLTAVDVQRAWYMGKYSENPYERYFLEAKANSFN